MLLKRGAKRSPQNTISWPLSAQYIKRCSSFEPSVLSFFQDLLYPKQSSTLYPREVILPSYLYPTDVTSEMDACHRPQLSKRLVTDLHLQGGFQLCTGKLVGQEVSRFRASVESESSMKRHSHKQSCHSHINFHFLGLR